MRNLEIRFANDGLAKEKDVEIERARAVRDARGAVAAELALDCQQPFEQSTRAELGFEGDDGIEKARLIGESDRCSGVKTGAGNDTAQQRHAFDGGSERDLRWAGWARQVGAEADVSSRH